MGEEVVSVYDVETGEPVTEPLATYPTVEELFAEVEDAIRREAFRLQAAYDDELGYPTNVSIDFLEYAVDEEMAFVVSNFEILVRIATYSLSPPRKVKARITRNGARSRSSSAGRIRL
jgi:hypothetical protein